MSASRLSTDLEPDRPVTCVQVLGGLANTMFQYAAGLAVAERTGGQVALDLSRHTARSPRPFALSALPIRASLWPAEPGLHKTLAITRRRLARLVGAAGPKVPHNWRGAVAVEPHFHYWSGLEAVRGDTLLIGLWQSYRYFAGHEDAVRAAFDLSAFAGPRIADTMRQIDDTNSVSVHIRRGDYISNPKAARQIGVLDEAYYRQALDRIDRLHDCALFVFTDDPESAAPMIADWPKARLITGNTQFEDMLLMARCRQHIIANSSYSWWAAWLDRRPNATVIAPKDWFRSKMRRDTNTDDLCPTTWLRV